MGAWDKIFETVREAVDDAAERTYKADRPSDFVTEVAGHMVVRSADEIDLEDLNVLLTKSDAKPGVNLLRIVEDVTSERELGRIFAFDQRDQGLASFVESVRLQNKELFEHMRRRTMSMEDMEAVAEKIGARDLVIRFLARKPGEMVPPEQALLGILSIVNWGKETQRAVDRARNTAGKSPEEITRERGIALRMLAMESQLAASVAGVASEYGRGMAVLRHASKLGPMSRMSKPIARFAEELDQIVGEFDDEKSIEFLLERYTALPKSSRIDFARKTIGRRTLDAIVEVWINSLLNSPVTHAVNIGSQGVFMGMNLAETQLAGVIGAVRTAIPGGSRLGAGAHDRVMMDEAWAEARGMSLAMLDAALLAGRVLVTETPEDLVSKIDVSNRRAIGNTGNVVEIGKQMANGNLIPAFVNILGVYARLGGRALLTEDEFFKVLGRRGKLYALAQNEAGTVFRLAREKGADRDTARQEASLAFVNFLEKPSPAALEEARDHARALTFQSELQGFAGAGQVIFSHPFMKFILPFYRTPMNIFKEGFDRTLPFGVLRAIKTGSGKDVDRALAKLAMGWGTALSMTHIVSGMYDENFFCTGAGPQDPNGRRQMRDMGIEPYSCSIKQEDGTYKNFTFSRFDPLSMTLAMASDYVHFVQNAQDMSQIEAATKALVLAVSEYGLELPMLQGLKDISEIVGGSYGSTESKVDRMSELFGEKAGQVAFSLVPPNPWGVPSRNSFLATMERLNGMDEGSLRDGVVTAAGPAAAVKGLPPGEFMGTPITELPSFIRGFYSAHVEAMGKTPGLSAELPAQRNMWNEVVYHSQGMGWEWASPVRIKSYDFEPLDRELMRLADKGIGTISQFPHMIDGVRLNYEERLEWIRLANETDLRGRAYGEDGHDASLTMLTRMRHKITTDEYKELDDDDKLRELKLIVGGHRDRARRHMTRTHIDLRSRMDDPPATIPQLLEAAE